MKESGEMYLESILRLSKESPYVRAIDISAFMGYSKPSVSRAIGLLRDRGYITVDDGGAIELTDSGRRIAENIFDRHQTLTKVLIYLGVDEETASEDACRMEHILSAETYDRIRAFLGDEP